MKESEKPLLSEWIAWLCEYPTVVKWLKRVGKGSRESYGDRFQLVYRWIREKGGPFANMTPCELVAYIRKSTLEEQYAFLDVLQEYINGLDELRYSTKYSRYSTFRSFFAHNRAHLPKDPNFIIRGDKPPVEGTLTAKQIRDVALASNLTYRAIILCMFQGGMGAEEFEYWNLNGWEDLQEDLRDKKQFFKVRQPGRKKNRNKNPYKTYISGDAKAALLEYLPLRELARDKFDGTRLQERDLVGRVRDDHVEKEFNPNAIFYSNWGTPVSKSAFNCHWVRMLVKLGIRKVVGDGDPANRYGDNRHEIRDVFRSQAQKTPVDKTIPEHMMGHKIDPLGYNKAIKDEPWVKSEIRKMMPMLDIMSSELPFGLITKEEYDGALFEAKDELRKAEEKIAQLEEGLDIPETESPDISDLSARYDQLTREMES